MSGAAGTPAPLLRTPFHDRHVAAGARMVDFAGWDMPVQYPSGHHRRAPRHPPPRRPVRRLAHGPLRAARPRRARRSCSTSSPTTPRLWTCSRRSTRWSRHRDRRRRRRRLPLPLRRRTSTCWWSTPPTAQGLGAFPRAALAGFPDVEMTDETGEIAMLALQGKASRDILGRPHRATAACPKPLRNELSVVTSPATAPVRLRVGRTGYTGEPICFELFVAADDAPALWDALVAAGAEPVGLGARDTLRLEAGLPLYGHELGLDPGGSEIPIFSCPLAAFAVSFSPLKGDYVGRARAGASAAGLRAASCGATTRSSTICRRLTRPVARDRPRHRPAGLPSGRSRDRRRGRSAGSPAAPPSPTGAWTATGCVRRSTERSRSCAPSRSPTSTAASSRTTRSRSTSAAGACPAWSCPTICAATRRPMPAPSSGTTSPSRPRCQRGDGPRAGEAAARRKPSPTTNGARRSASTSSPPR